MNKEKTLMLSELFQWFHYTHNDDDKLAILFSKNEKQQKKHDKPTENDQMFVIVCVFFLAVSTINLCSHIQNKIIHVCLCQIVWPQYAITKWRRKKNKKIILTKSHVHLPNIMFFWMRKFFRPWQSFFVFIWTVRLFASFLHHLFSLIFFQGNIQL